MNWAWCLCIGTPATLFSFSLISWFRAIFFSYVWNDTRHTHAQAFEQIVPSALDATKSPYLLYLRYIFIFSGVTHFSTSSQPNSSLVSQPDSSGIKFKPFSFCLIPARVFIRQFKLMHISLTKELHWGFSLNKIRCVYLKVGVTDTEGETDGERLRAHTYSCFHWFTLKMVTCRLSVFLKLSTLLSTYQAFTKNMIKCQTYVLILLKMI